MENKEFAKPLEQKSNLVSCSNERLELIKDRKIDHLSDYCKILGDHFLERLKENNPNLTSKLHHGLYYLNYIIRENNFGFLSKYVGKKVLNLNCFASPYGALSNSNEEIEIYNPSLEYKVSRIADEIKDVANVNIKVNRTLKGLEYENATNELKGKVL